MIKKPKNDSSVETEKGALKDSATKIPPDSNRIRNKSTLADGSPITTGKNRNIRVFISSTFQDMQEERDVLVKKIFLQLRKMCMERSVGFTEVDLRWGVTREQAERGEVLPICLAEIENCRPYFIGLLGERYGWVPDFISDELIDDQPWLAEHRQRSVTELEIVHGVLHNPDMADHAFFYIRDPSASPAHSEGQIEKDKQTALKNRILQSGFPVRENYPDAETVGQLILKDLEKAISNEFPAQQLTPLERDRLDHEVFAESRAEVYIGRQDYFDRLDKHASGRNGDPLAVLGESGSGKSALLANWGFRFQEKHPDTFLLLHFIGSSTDSTDYVAMLRRIMMEIKKRYDLQYDIPDTPEELRTQFPNWLSMAAAQGRFVLVLDALNQLEDNDNAPDLIWLPEFIPPEVRLIVSTLPGRSLYTLEKRKWSSMEVQLLEKKERQQLIKDYLYKLYSKKLAFEQVQRIASEKKCANPLFLHALLEELRIFGKHEELQRRIDHYLEARDIKNLYELILNRLEEDYKQDRPDLVREAMTLLWAARRGLTESELLEIMDIPPLTWTYIYLALQGSLIICSGLITFFHDFLRQAVLTKYIKTFETEKASHLRIANYFEPRDIDQRKIDELPWQLAQAQEWKMLQNCLVDLPFFKAASGQYQFEVLGYWQRIEHNSDLICTEAYDNVLAAPDKFIDFLFPLSALFDARGNLKEALQLSKAQEKYYRDIGDTSKLQVSLGNQGVILESLGDIEDAMTLYKEQERICREFGYKDYLQITLGNQGVILQTLGDLGGAMALFKEQEQICRKLGNKDFLQSTLSNQGVILRTLGDLDGAMALFKEQERICREFGYKDYLQVSLCRQGNILKTLGNLDGAMVLYKKQERICRELGRKSGIASALCNQGNILCTRGDLDGAMVLYKEDERICREMGNKDSLQNTLGNQGVILQTLGDLDGAMALFKEQEKICRKLGNKDFLQSTIGNQGVILKKRGDLDGALILYKEQERICREMGNKDFLHITLGNQGVILKQRGNLDGAMVLYKEQERICRELGNNSGLASALCNQGNILGKRGDPDGAMVLYKEQERICRELTAIYELSLCLCNQALLIAAHSSQPREALPLAEEAYNLAATHGIQELERRIRHILNQMQVLL